MRRRILQSTLIVVALTALVLGGPLAITTWRLVEDFSRSDLTSRLEQLGERLDGSAELDSNDRAAIELAVPPHGRLVIEPNGEAPLTFGDDPGPDPVAETLPFGPGGSLTMSSPRLLMRTEQLQVTAVVLLLIVLSVGTGTVVATVTARRLAEPLSDVADRAARLGAGDFRSAPGRHGIPELVRVSDVLDTSAGAHSAMARRPRGGPGLRRAGHVGGGALGAGAARTHAGRGCLAPDAQPAHRAAVAPRRAGRAPRPGRRPGGDRRAGAGRAPGRRARRAARGGPRRPRGRGGAAGSQGRAHRGGRGVEAAAQVARADAAGAAAHRAAGPGHPGPAA